MPKETQSAGPLLRLPSVEVKTCLSKTEIYRRIKEKTFPRPVKLGVRAVAWTSASIDEWVQSLIQSADK
ncbi:AlpA family phage regulatory protein [Lacisediminimonas profundi]|uniref:AlpA family phage regulatory protein n=1 Tax=Lacisediminimonas profundi TaxID=2603856 RepID=UPI00124BB392|nr:AlpA family transcriptional regulator [Lacisediminimonas profundi]